MEEVREDTRQADIKVTKEAGARTIRVTGPKEGEVTNDIQEEVKEDMGTQRDNKEEVKEDTKEEAKEDIRGGTRGLTRARKVEVNEEATVMSRTASGIATSAEAKGTSP